MTCKVAGQHITAPDAGGHGLDMSNGQDWLAHIGQSWNDEGLRGLLRPANWLPGVCRGLVATAGGQVRAANCHATRWWIRLEGHSGPRMGRKEAFAVVERRERLRAELTGRFPAAACPGR